MGRPLPGYRVQITDNDGHVTKEGEVTLVLGADRPAGLMQGYQGDDGKLSGADGDLYRSGDVVFADDEGYLTFVGRSDDVFNSSDYRISPFELESVLLEHELVAKAAVVPAPIRSGWPFRKPMCCWWGAERSTDPLSISTHLHTRLAPFKRIRRIGRHRIAEDDLERSAACNCAGWSTTSRGDALRGTEFREKQFPGLQKVRLPPDLES